MIEDFVLKAFEKITVHERSLSTKGALKAVKASGSVPGILYFKDCKTFPLSLEVNHFNKIISDPSCFTRIFHLTVKNIDVFCILKEVQFDPVSDAPTHFDFMEVRSGDVVKVSVPVRVVNREICPGVKTGGDVYVLSRNVLLTCKIDAEHHVPSSIDVDVSKSTIGMKYFLSDVAIPANCKIVHNVILLRIAGKRVIKDAVVQEAASSETAAEAPSAPEKK